MIELTEQQLRTCDGLVTEVKMIQTLQGWKQQIQQANWLPNEWSDEWREAILPFLDKIALPPQQPQQPSIFKPNENA